MKTAAAIVTNRGGRTCHAAIIARELGVPAVVGTGDATTATRRRGMVTVSCGEGDTGRVYRGEVPLPRRAHRGRRSRSPGDEDHDQPRQPGPRVQDLVPAERRRRAGADGVHHQRVHQGAPARPRAPRAGDRPAGARDARAADPRLPRRRELLRGAPVGGHRHDRRGVLAQAGRRADVGLQDQRVREPARRRRLRAARGQPDDRLSRRVALRASGLRGGLRARVPGDEAGARGDGADERRS